MHAVIDFGESPILPSSHEQARKSKAKPAGTMSSGGSGISHHAMVSVYEFILNLYLYVVHHILLF